MGTHFLKAGMLLDGLTDLREQARYLRTLLQLTDQQRTALVLRYEQEGYYTTFAQEVEKTLDSLVRGAEELHDFIAGLPCEPLIYTGEGETDDVVKMLDALLDRHAAAVRPGES